MRTNSLFKRVGALKAGLAFGALSLILPAQGQSQPDPDWLAHDRNRPQPPKVKAPGASTQERPGQPPSDAVVLFDGQDLSRWVDMSGNPTKWVLKDGVMECVKGSGYIRTLQNFGDCQLHIEWAAPLPAEGTGQGRGNSGVFFGFTRYELQVLDSYDNTTYADGSAGSIYGQYPPLVNVTRPPGEWQSYDVLYTAPRFDAEGKLLSPARITAFHNGVLIQHNVELTGPTSWLERAPYQAHPEKQPISLQDHGNPVRYRNIWVRELGQPSRKEFTYGNTLLDRYTGTYDRGGSRVSITREGNQLIMRMDGARFVLFAESPTRFFAKTTDVRCEFQPDQEGSVNTMLISVGEGSMTARRTR